MENNWYIPSEDEIRVGLYCVFTTLDNGFSEDSFLRPYNTHEDDITDCLEDGLTGADIKELLSFFDTMQDVCQQIRVKYLDKEDIERVLGVKQLKGNGIELNFQIIADDDKLFYEIDYDVYDRLLTIEKFVETEEENNHHCFTLLHMVVKNKSEFEKIIYRLGILEQ